MPSVAELKMSLPHSLRQFPATLMMVLRSQLDVLRTNPLLSIAICPIGMNGLSVQSHVELARQSATEKSPILPVAVEKVAMVSCRKSKIAQPGIVQVVQLQKIAPGASGADGAHAPNAVASKLGTATL